MVVSDVMGRVLGKHVGVEWAFDLKNKELVLTFSILSLVQVEKDVKLAVCKAFGLQKYVPVLDISFPEGVQPMRFVLQKVDEIDALLEKMTVESGYVRSLVF